MMKINLLAFFLFWGEREEVPEAGAWSRFDEDAEAGGEGGLSEEEAVGAEGQRGWKKP